VRELAIVLVDDPNDLARIENVLGILDSTNLLITLTTLPPGQVGFAAKALSNELILTSLRTGNSGQIKHILSNITPSDAVRILTTDVEGFVNQNDVITVSPGTNTTAVNPNAALSSINTAGSVFGNTNVSSSAPIAGVPSTKERAGVAVLAGLSTQDRVNFLSSLTPEQRAEILNDYNDDEMLRIVYGMTERQITNTFTGMYNRASPSTRRWLDAVETPVRSALFSFIGTGQVQYPTVRDTLDIIAAGSGNEKIRKAVAVVKILSRVKGLKESIEPFLNQGLNEVFGFGTQEFSTAVGGLTIASKIPVPVFPIGGQIRSNPWDEPSSPYKAEYPKNDVKRTESGHIFELDDTPGAERVHIYHRAGSFVEFHPDGSVVYRTIGNNYQITAQNQFVNIQGSCNITIDGSAEMYIAGDLIKKIGGNVVEIVGGNYRKEITGDYTELVMGSKQTQTIVSESSLVGGTRNTTTLLSRTDIVLAYEEKFVGMAYNEQILGVDTRIVGGIKTTSVAGACVLGVGGAYTETVGGAILMNAGGIINSIAGGAITMEAGGAIVGLAGGTITFSAGAAAVFASAAITQILGVLVRLN
jgi:ribosomal protein S28E/S33